MRTIKLPNAIGRPFSVAAWHDGFAVLFGGPKTNDDGLWLLVMNLYGVRWNSACQAVVD